MNHYVRYLDLDSKVPSKKYAGKTVKELCDDPNGIAWLTWMESPAGLDAVQAKLNGLGAREYYEQKLKEFSTIKTPTT